MKTLRKDLSVGLLGLILFSANAQDDIPNLIPPSPAATAIQRVGIDQMNYHTGAAEISIPIYEMKLKDLSVPISLNHTGQHGIKVQEIASWVGLGWSLSAGGAVSREIRHLPDDSQFGYFSLPFPLPIGGSPTPNYLINDRNNNGVSDYEEITRGEIDAEPDYFHYSAPGLSGSFLIQKDGSIFHVPFSDNKISFNHDPVQHRFNSFTVIDTRGIVYLFSSIEYIFSRQMGSTVSDMSIKPSTWYLTSITNSNGDETIFFEYEFESGDPLSSFNPTNNSMNSQVIQNYTETRNNKMTSTEPGHSFLPKYNETRTWQLRPSRIYNNQTDIEVLFQEGAERFDLKGAHYLEFIEIESENERIKKIEFDYSYFDISGVSELSEGIGTYSPIAFNYDDGNHEKRLRLDKITEYGRFNKTLPPYLFTYEESVLLPSRNSYSRDHWGFYNGKNNSDLEPVQYLDLNGIGQLGFQIYGKANRDVDFNFGKAGMLKQITYPTGGYTRFTYEPNTATNVALPSKGENKSETHWMDLLDNQTWFTVININLNQFPFTQLRITTSVDQPISMNCDILIEIRENQSNSLVASGRLSGATNFVSEGRIFNIPEGDYKIVFQPDDINDLNNSCFQGDMIALGIHWIEDKSGATGNLVGGARLLKLENCAEDDCTIKTYSYKLLNTKSSGLVTSNPEYGYPEYIDETHLTGVFLPFFSTWNRTYTSNLPILSVMGNTVGYKRITELIGINGEGGSNVFEYEAVEDVELSLYNNNGYGAKIFNSDNGKYYKAWPSVPFTPLDWIRGRITSSSIHKYVNGAFQVAESSNSDYEKFYNHGVIAPDQGEVPVMTGISWDCNYGPLGCEYMYAIPYHIASGRVYQASKQIDSYESGKVLTTINNYEMHDTFQIPISEKVTYPSGEMIQTDYTYNVDYDYSVLQLLGLESSENVLQGMFNDKNIIYPFYTKQVSITDAETLSQRVVLYDEVAGSKYLLDEVRTAKGTGILEPVVEYLEYNPNGYPLSYRSKDGLIHSLEWDENRVISSAISSVPIIDFNNTASLQDLVILQKYEYDFAGRLFKITDSNGKVMNYEYDSFGRLSQIKDHDGKIIQKLDYNYKQD